MHFTKMHGLGNDYIYVDCSIEKVVNPSLLARKISDRHFGVGSDGLVLILPSDEADFEMRMFNSDGSESSICGNAVRCIGKYVFDRHLTDKDIIHLKTGAGIKTLQLKIADGKVHTVDVDMGEPVLTPSDIPVLFNEDVCVNLPIHIKNEEYRVTCVGMGNPHCVLFTENAENVKIDEIGPILERHPMFPQRTNVEFATVINRKEIRMRVWERGAGETMACGSGACATLVAAVLNALCDHDVILHLNGGDLQIRWQKENRHIFMEGPAEFVFDGEWES